MTTTPTAAPSDKKLHEWLNAQAAKLMTLEAKGHKLKLDFVQNARDKGKILIQVHDRLATDFKMWVLENTDIGYSTAHLYMDVAENYTEVKRLLADSNPLELSLRQVRDAIRDARQAKGRGKPGSGRRASQKDAADAENESSKSGNGGLASPNADEEDGAGTDEEDGVGTDEEATGDTARWEREVGKAEAEAAQDEGGEQAEAASSLYAVTVFMFTESDQTAMYQALSNWSPIRKTLAGTKQARSVTAHVLPNGIGALLHQLGDTLEQNQPRKVRVSIEL